MGTVEELKLAQIDLGNILSRWQPLKGWQRAGATSGRRQTVNAEDIKDSVIARHSQIDHEGLLAALQILEGSVFLRIGTAHTNSQGRILDGYAALDVDPRGIPAVQWEQICRAVLNAAARIRSLITALEGGPG